MNDTYTNLYFNKNYDENILNISLIISDDQITHVEIDPNKSQDIEMICEDVCKKYKLESKIKKKLTKEINRRLNEFLSNKESKDKKKHKSNKNLVNQNLVERLYYESIEKNRKRTEFMNQIKSDYEIEEMSKFTFSPSINKRSNLLFKKNYSRVEDRLHYNQHKKKENSQMEFDFKDKTKNYSNNIVRTEENKIYSINNSINSKDRDKYFPFNIIKSKNKINTKNNFEIYNENYKDKDKDILSNNNKGDKTLRKKINKKIEEKEIEKRKNNINIRYNKLDFHTLDKERNKINKSNKTNEKYKSKSKSKNKDKNKIKDKDIIKDKDKNLYLNTNESNNNNIKNTKEIDLSHISPINIIKNVATIDESNDDSYICLKTQNNNFDKLNEKNDKIKKNINEDKDYQFIQSK
jgi:hypothetical protein